MNVSGAGGPECERIRGYLDAYVSNELLVETNHEVRRHLEGCPDCTVELQARTSLRARLQAAVRATPVPDDLPNKVRRAVRGSSGRTHLGLYVMAAAAAILLFAVVIDRVRARANPEEAILRSATGRLAPVLNIGLRDHLQCAVFRKYSKQPEPAAQMAEQLGPEFAGLAGVLRAKLPGDFRILQGHRCIVSDRQYVHFIVSRGTRLMSVVLTRARPGESLAGGIYQEGVDHFQVVGFESHGYLAYVISDMEPQENLQLAVRLAPAVREYLGTRL